MNVQTTDPPRLLDLCCCEGAAAKGYADLGFVPVGIDTKKQPKYPYRFIRADAVETVKAIGWMFDAIHASPPCQDHSDLKHRTGKNYPDIIDDLRAVLLELDVPWVVENVEGAPLRNPMTLCGSMFGLGATCRDGVYRTLRRHRLFESNVFLVPPGPDACTGRAIGGIYGTGGGGKMTRGYKFHPEEAAAAIEVDWLSRYGQSQAIPPAYTRWIGAQLLEHVTGRDLERAA